MKVSSGDLLQHVSDDVASFISEAPERTWRQYSAFNLTQTLLKKFVEPGKEATSADAGALSKFLEVNTGLLDAPRECETLLDQLLMGELKNSLSNFWLRGGDPLVMGLGDLYLKGRVGPGSSLNVRGCDLYSKLFASRMTTTSELLYESYRTASLSTMSTDVAEKFRASTHGACEVVTASKLLFVPKSNEISRTICVEPSLNMFYQLGLGAILETRLREVFKIDLSTQPDFNRELSRRGSLDGSFATIDLSSASDSLSLGVLRNILPQGMYSWLAALRTPKTKLPDGRIVDLRMVSTMGNGFTFPLETIIFASVVASAYRVNGTRLLKNRGVLPGNFAVFGDDIIVEASIASKVLRLLWLLGFTVNKDKTFVEGPFRESCGSDWFKGRNVRGVYIKSLDTPQDRYVAINLLNDWSAGSNIPLPKSIGYLLESVPRVFIPPWYGLDRGIHVSRITNPDSPRRNMNGSYKVRSYEPRGVSVMIQDDGRSVLDEGREPNQMGLELTFIAGYIRSGRISLRQRQVRYQKKTSIAPFWDSIDENRSRDRFSFRRWEVAVFKNIISNVT